jgi:N-acetylmuramoyl-L-alanine amidase
MMQSNYLDQSILFADYVQTQFESRVGRKNRGVKQAGVWVISYTMMPSVLIELGFISNHAEEDFLNTEKGQVYMASAIYRAFKQYKIDMEGYDATQEDAPPAKPTTQKVEPATGTAPTTVAINNELPTTTQGLEYRVKIASSKKSLELKPYNFKGAKDLSVEQSGAYYTYFSGRFTSLSDAETSLKKLQANGFKDAYVVAFYNQKQISIKEAQSMQNSK